MADATVNAPFSGSAGAPFKMDQDGGLVNWPYTKLAWGPSGTQNELDDAAGKRLPIIKSGCGTVVVGQVSPGASATQMGSNAVRTCTFKASQANTDKVYIGLVGVTTSTGFELNAGDSVTLDINNTNLIYHIAASGTQTLCYIGEN